MNQIENEKNKLKKTSRKLKNKSIKKEIEENYEIGIEYYKNIEEQQNK